ncbi:hypothetical protein K7432_014830, partial [Basidiobolus ranarum]
LPQYYETSKLASFTRQLNIYGFERVSDRRRTKQSAATSSIVYSHQHFKRDQPNSLHLIQRISGPYPKVRNQAEILAENKDIRPKLLPSSLSSVLSSTPRANLHSISQEECQSVCTKDIAVDCPSCMALKCEVEALRKTIEYYRSLVENSINYIEILTNGQEACTVDISQSLIPSFTVPVSLEDGLLSLWANSDPNVYSYIYPYPSSIDDTQCFPRVS